MVFSFVNTTFIAFSWLIFFSLNKLIFSSFDVHPEYASLIFLPAGLRLIFTIIYLEYAVFGLFLGAIITSYFYLNHNLLNLIILPAISSLIPFVTIWFCSKVKFFQFNISLDNLKPVHILLLSGMCSIFCPLPHTLALYIFHQIDARSFWFTYSGMMVGDFFGSFLMLVLVGVILKVKNIW